MEPVLPPDLGSTDEPDSIEITQARVSAALGRLIVVAKYDDEIVRPESEFGCEQCKGDGWIRRHGLHPTHPDFGKVFPCPGCREPKTQARRLERIFAAAEIPSEYRNDASFAAYAELGRNGDQEARATVEAWVASSQEATSRSRSLYLYGPLGHGKTTLAIAAGLALLEQGLPLLFITTIDLLDRLRAAYGDDGVSADQVMGAAKEAGVLILDEIGRERVQEGKKGEWVKERLYALVNHRHNARRPTIFTSNKSLDELAGHIDDDGATAWRIKQMCWPNVVNVHRGKNLRDLDLEK